jgi:hypothetical protein
MLRKKIRIILLILLGTGLTTIHAQNATATAGSNASGSGGSVSYSVGQLVYITNTGNSGSEAQGVQQPYEISIVSGIVRANNPVLNLSAYPNPTTGLIILNIGNYANENLSYQLYDLYGTRLENKNISEIQTIISLDNLASAIYFLKLTNNNKEVKTFKIIKY